MNTPLERNILLNPGPVTTTTTVKNSLVVPDICHREKTFVELLHNVCNDIVKVVGDLQYWQAVPFATSGTGVIEACLSSLQYRDKRILIINNGEYGHRLVEIAHAYNLPYVNFISPLNEALDLLKLKDYIAKHNDIGFIAFVHHETSTGMLNPLEKIVALAKQFNLMTIVDAISSFAGTPINLNDHPVDFLCISVNKCLQAFPGLAFVIVNKKIISQENFQPRNYYFDLYAQIKSQNTNGQMRFTAPVQLVYAAQQALNELFAEGIEKHIQRLNENFAILTHGLIKLGFKFYLPESCRCSLLISILEPTISKFDFMKLHDKLFADNFTIYPGQISLTKTFRLATMGDLTTQDIHNFLKSLEKNLNVLDMLPIQY